MTDTVYFSKKGQQIYFSESFQTVPFFPYGKGRAITVQAWTVPEGSRRLRLLDFKTIGI